MTRGASDNEHFDDLPNQGTRSAVSLTRDPNQQQQKCFYVSQGISEDLTSQATSDCYCVDRPLFDLLNA